MMRWFGGLLLLTPPFFGPAPCALPRLLFAGVKAALLHAVCHCGAHDVVCCRRSNPPLPAPQHIIETVADGGNQTAEPKGPALKWDTTPDRAGIEPQRLWTWHPKHPARRQKRPGAPHPSGAKNTRPPPWQQAPKTLTRHQKHREDKNRPPKHPAPKPSQKALLTTNTETGAKNTLP